MSEQVEYIEGLSNKAKFYTDGSASPEWFVTREPQENSPVSVEIKSGAKVLTEVSRAEITEIAKRLDAETDKIEKAREELLVADDAKNKKLQASAVAKLQKLGLTEEEARSL